MTLKSVEKRFGASILWLVIAAAAVVNLLPIVFGLATSLKSESQIFDLGTPLWGFRPIISNYQAVVAGTFSSAFVTSLLYSVGVTFASLVLAALSAYALDRVRFSGRNVIFYAIVACVPLSIGAAVLVVPDYIYFSDLGLINHWFTLPLWYLGLHLPLTVWIIKGSLEGIGRDLDDAARVDGLGHIGVLFRVLLPLCRPGLFAAGVLVYLGCWNEFIGGSVFVQDAGLTPVQVAIYQYISSFGLQWGPLSAAALMGIVPITVLVIVFGRHLVSGLTQGALKG